MYYSGTSPSSGRDSPVVRKVLSARPGDEKLEHSNNRCRPNYLASLDHRIGVDQTDPPNLISLVDVYGLTGRLCGPRDVEVLCLVRRPYGGLEGEEVLKWTGPPTSLLFHLARGGGSGVFLCLVDVAAGKLPEIGIDDEPVPTHHEDLVTVVHRNHRGRLGSRHPLLEAHPVRKFDLRDRDPGPPGSIDYPFVNSAAAPVVCVFPMRGSRRTVIGCRQSSQAK